MESELRTTFHCECGRINMIDKKEIQKCKNCGKPINKEKAKQFIQKEIKDIYEMTKIPVRHDKETYKAASFETLNHYSFEELYEQVDYKGNTYEEWFVKGLYVAICCNCYNVVNGYRFLVKILKSSDLERYMFYHYIFTLDYYDYPSDLPRERYPIPSVIGHNVREGWNVYLFNNSVSVLKHLATLCLWTFTYLRTPRWKYVERYNKNIELDKQGKLSNMDVLRTMGYGIKGKMWRK